MAMSPQSGVQLDVTESVVAFTPPGAAQAIPVSMGNGLSVSPAGVAVPRPINPVVAQQITAINQAAVQATENVSLDAVAAPVPEGGEQSEDTKGEGEVPIPKAMMMVVMETLRVEMTAGTAIPVMMVAERSQTADPRMQVVEVPTLPCGVQCLKIMLIFNKSEKQVR